MRITKRDTMLCEDKEPHCSRGTQERPAGAKGIRRAAEHQGNDTEYAPAV